MKEIYTRDGITTIDQLQPYKMYGRRDDIIRYNFHQMVGIINTKLGFDQRDCADELVNLGFNIPPHDDPNYRKFKYCDYWHYQLESIFRNEVRNDQCNTIYVGNSNGVNLKKLKKQPNDWQLFLLNEWNKMFHHLADKNGWIKVELWW